MKYNYIFFVVILFLLVSCSGPKNFGFYSFETECLGVQLDGSQTLKSYGRAGNKHDAVEQARKNAVSDVIFKGIGKGTSNCSRMPLLVKVNARQKYEDYFFHFFSDNGLYSKFVTNPNGWKKTRYSAGDGVVYGVVVQVNRDKLKNQLIKDGILK